MRILKNTNDVSSAFEPSLKTMYQTEFNPYYFTKAKQCVLADDEVETIELYAPETSDRLGKKKSWGQLQDAWTKSDAHKRFNQQFPKNQINYDEDPVFRNGGKKLTILSPAVMYKYLRQSKNY